MDDLPIEDIKVNTIYLDIEDHREGDSNID